PYTYTEGPVKTLFPSPTGCLNVLTAAGLLCVFMVLLALPQRGYSADAGAQPTTSAEAISANPGAVNILSGTGLLGRLLGFDADSGVRLGGLWIGNADYLFTGGIRPRTWSFNSLLLVDLNLDAEKLVGLPGGQLGVEYLQFNGQAANNKAGAIIGYDGLTGPPPLARSELYELWWRQRFFDDKFGIRVGKPAPPYDFHQVSA